MSDSYEVTIGLEVHCQVKSASKMFCSCATAFGEEPNTHICPVCLGLPGALPTLNAYAIEQTILAGMLLECETPEISTWDRKHYFYPDMPKNFQLTQYEAPLCLGGYVPLHRMAFPKDVQNAPLEFDKKIRLTRIHLEEDVAKSTHKGRHTTIDFNRAGTPLMEIVSQPDLTTPEEAYAYLKSLQQILIYGGISDADMEKGQMRCDVNVSLRKKGEKELGEKIELKNLNSISAVRRALHYEIERQREELNAGVSQVQSTRRWDDVLGESQLMREKEDAHDYRYFPEPDLLPLETKIWKERAAQKVCELPQEKRARLMQLGLSEYAASVLADQRALADYFDQALPKPSLAKKTANWILNELLAKLNEEGKSLEDIPLAPKVLGELVELIEEGVVSSSQAKTLFAALWIEPQLSARQKALEMGFEKSDDADIEQLIDTVIAQNPDKVSAIAQGNHKLINFLTGQVMKASKGKANAKRVTELLSHQLLP